MDAERITAMLAEKLDQKHVKPRKANGPKGDYIEGWFAIAEANRIFGPLNWSHEILFLTAVSERERPIGQNKLDGWGVTYRCSVQVRVGEIVKHGVGAGHGYGLDLGQAHESAAKEAETDALKRALVKFGWPFGLALYDKERAHVEDTTARLGVEKRAEEILAKIKTLDDLGEYEGFANGIRNEVRDMTRNGFAELAAQIKAAMVSKKAELEAK